MPPLLSRWFAFSNDYSSFCTARFISFIAYSTFKLPNCPSLLHILCCIGSILHFHCLSSHLYPNLPSTSIFYVYKLKFLLISIVSPTSVCPNLAYWALI